MDGSSTNLDLHRLARNAAAFAALLHGALWAAPLILAAAGAPSLLRAMADRDLELPPITSLMLSLAVLVIRYWYLFPLLFLLGLLFDGWLLYRLSQGHGLHARAARRVWSVVVVMLPLVASGFVVIAYLLPVLTIIGTNRL